jgi:hypothetical protein
MKKPYLIQRVGVREKVKGNEGTFDQVLSCDYMGSAEFENGELPKSLKRICKNISNTSVYKTDEIKNKHVESLCIFIDYTKDVDEYICHILDIINGKLYLKEQTYIES